MVLEAPEAQGTDEIPRQQLTAKVRNIQIFNEDVALLHLKTPRTQRLRFLAGQQVQLGGNAMPVAQPCLKMACRQPNCRWIRLSMNRQSGVDLALLQDDIAHDFFGQLAGFFIKFRIPIVDKLGRLDLTVESG